MKTANSVEQQEERKKARDNCSEDRRSLRADTQPVTQKKSRYEGYGKRIAPWKWKPGQCGNPHNKGRNDVASEIARAVFENNAEALYKAYCKIALKGNAYAFKELADRAFGKLRETRTIEHAPLQDVSTPDLEKHIEQLEAKLIASLVERGYTVTEPPQLQPPADDTKPN